MFLDRSSTGIAVMAYSRPRHVAQLFKALRRHGVERFSVFMDGADDHHIRDSQEEIVTQVQAIDWADVRLVQRSINMGLRRSIVSAVTEQLNRYEEVILLEDDCVPQEGFFEFMFQSLEAFRTRPEIRSVCGYQFPSVSVEGDAIRAVPSTRFVPWGWATWRDRWRDYDTDLAHLVSMVEQNGLFSTLPNDIRTFLSTWKRSRDTDIWSINWVLAHYLSDSYCLYPSRSLMRNIGFDGTGVHCYQTDAFLIEGTGLRSGQRIVIDPDVTLDQDMDSRIISYMEDHWSSTMKPSRVGTVGEVTAWGIERAVERALDEAAILDFHTHLMPEDGGTIGLSGPDELLRYHYLAVEALGVTGFDPETYASMSPSDQARFVWNALFRDRTPLSEACLGILTILDHFGIKTGPRDYGEIRREMIGAGYSASDVFSAARVRKVVMTNDPFAPEEWKVFQLQDWDRSVFLASMRIDQIVANSAVRQGFLKSAASGNELSILNSGKLFAFLDARAMEASPVYASWSASGGQLERALSDPMVTEGLLPWLLQHGLPLVVKLGARRAVNPSLGSGGDGMGGDGLDALERLVRTNPHQLFLVTHLRDDAQHGLTVLARKFQNLKLLGFCWFVNHPSLIRRHLEMRFDLIGADFIAHHSDARVMEQLIYTWAHFKAILTETLSDRYRGRIRAGWPMDQDAVARDIQALLYGNALKAIHRPNDSSEKGV